MRKIYKLKTETLRKKNEDGDIEENIKMSETLFQGLKRACID